MASGKPLPTAQGTATQLQSPSVGSDPAILVVSLTPDYRHNVIPTANQALKEIGDKIAQESNADEIVVDIIDSVDDNTPPTEFPTEVNELSQYDVLVFSISNDANPPESTDTLVLNDEQATAFEEYIRSGGGFVGIHSAVDNQTDGSFFNSMFHTYYDDHPEVQEGQIHVIDQTHPSTDHLPAEWNLTAEWYNFTRNPRGKAHILCTADESSYNETGYTGGEMEGTDHPLTWCQNVDSGRSWYTGLGHRPEQWQNADFREHVRGGIMWAAGYVDGGASGTVWNSYSKVPLDTNTASPSMLDIASDGRVFYIDRADYNNDDVEKIAVIKQDTPDNETTIALELSVHGTNNGLKGMALDPNFENNGWVYLYYAPPSNEIDYAYNRLSRFTVENNTINPDSETSILEIPVQREVSGHYGGDIEFSPNGKELYLTTGDATTPFMGNYAPIDEREGKALHDAQRTASNTADLGGSILRIIPEDDGSYSIPEDNLFTQARGYGQEINQGLVRPEIYTMGVRNPYRASVDPETGALYWSDYGPDAGSWDPQRGQPGIVEFNKATEPGFYGWPYFTGPNIPYKDYNYGPGKEEGVFDPNNPRNDSPHNTGLTQLPKAQEAMIYYPASWSSLLNAPDYAAEYVPNKAPFPQLEGGSPMAGPVYRYSDNYDPHRSLPDSFDGKFFIMERGANWIKYISFDDDGNVMEIDPFLPQMKFKKPMDMKVGPDGALYLVEWGSGYEGPNNDSGIYRIEHSSIQTEEGPPPIGNSDSAPTDPDNDGLYEDINGDGEVTDADGELFFKHIDDPEMQDNVEAFDFNGNGRLDFDDIVEWRKKRDNR